MTCSWVVTGTDHNISTTGAVYTIGTDTIICVNRWQHTFSFFSFIWVGHAYGIPYILKHFIQFFIWVGHSCEICAGCLGRRLAFVLTRTFLVFSG